MCAASVCVWCEHHFFTEKIAASGGTRTHNTLLYFTEVYGLCIVQVYMYMYIV